MTKKKKKKNETAKNPPRRPKISTRDEEVAVSLSRIATIARRYEEEIRSGKATALPSFEKLVHETLYLFATCNSNPTKKDEDA